MATKAERFRALEERSRQKPQPERKPPPSTVTPSGVKRASVRLETSATTPSRKSTRKSANHAMPSTNLERREQRKRRTPEFRAAAHAAKATRVRGH
jgi:hypothetical protein